MSGYRMEWTESALDLLGRLVEQVGRHDPAAAAGIVKEIFDLSRVLADHPQGGRRFPPSADPCVHEILIQDYRLIYRIDEASRRVSVAAVQHVHPGGSPRQPGTR